MKICGSRFAADGSVGAAPNIGVKSPCAGHDIGHSAGLLARLFLLKFVRNDAIGDALLRVSGVAGEVSQERPQDMSSEPAAVAVPEPEPAAEPELPPPEELDTLEWFDTEDFLEK